MSRHTTTRGSHFSPFIPNEATEVALQAAVAAADVDPNAPKFPFFGDNEIHPEIASVYAENMELYILQKQRELAISSSYSLHSSSITDQLTDLPAQIKALRLQISQIKAENDFLAAHLLVNEYTVELLSFRLQALAIQGELSNLMQHLAALSSYVGDFARAKQGECFKTPWQL